MWYIHTTNCYLAIKKSKMWTYAKYCTHAAKLLQSCPTLFNPMDCCPPGSSVHRILQARILEWVAMPSSSRSSRPRDRTPVSCIFCYLPVVFYNSRKVWKSYTFSVFKCPAAFLALYVVFGKHFGALVNILVNGEKKNTPVSSGDLN